MLPDIRTPLPGPKSRALAARLRSVEGANVTFLPQDESFPIFWESGNGCLMGDVHPTVAKLELCEELCRISRLPAAKVILGTSGGDAVEAAIKSAILRTGKHRVVAFDGGYHGLNLGALNATARHDFRMPFHRHLADFVTHFPYGSPLE
ncbi:MAG: hypothetical protein RLZZ78_1931, partial [Armatimonadota bacterium]